jgi:hypothetical protein
MDNKTFTFEIVGKIKASDKRDAQKKLSSMLYEVECSGIDVREEEVIK